MKVDLTRASREQLIRMVVLRDELDQQRLDLNNGFMISAMAHPDCSPALDRMFRAWSIAQNRLSQTDAELMDRITTGREPDDTIN